MRVDARTGQYLDWGVFDFDTLSAPKDVVWADDVMHRYGIYSYDPVLLILCGEWPVINKRANKKVVINPAAKMVYLNVKDISDETVKEELLDIKFTKLSKLEA